eukprot:8899997-Alexandrium_andersonii.AAC.1
MSDSLDPKQSNCRDSRNANRLQNNNAKAWRWQADRQQAGALPEGRRRGRAARGKAKMEGDEAKRGRGARGEGGEEADGWQPRAARGHPAGTEELIRDAEPDMHNDTDGR